MSRSISLLGNPTFPGAIPQPPTQPSCHDIDSSPSRASVALLNAEPPPTRPRSNHGTAISPLTITPVSAPSASPTSFPRLARHHLVTTSLTPGRPTCRPATTGEPRAHRSSVSTEATTKQTPPTRSQRQPHNTHPISRHARPPPTPPAHTMSISQSTVG